MNRIPVSFAISTGLLLASASLPATAQDTPTHDAAKRLTATERSDHFMYDSVDREYKLHFAASVQDANEILTSIRNMIDPQTKVFLVPSTGIIAVHAPEDVQAQIAKLLAALDQPHPRYRLTYTLTELDGTHKVGLQHFSMVVISGQRSQIKQGSRLPIVTASGGPGQFQYIDIGMNFDATLTEVQGGGVLKNKVEQTSIAPDSITPANPNPVFRQTTLEGTTSLTLNKPQTIGALDVPSSTHHFDIEVVMEPAN